MKIEPYYFFIVGGIWVIGTLIYFFGRNRKKTIMVKYPHLGSLNKVPDIIDYPKNLHITLVQDSDYTPDEDVFCDMVIHMDDLIKGNYKIPDHLTEINMEAFDIEFESNEEKKIIIDTNPVLKEHPERKYISLKFYKTDF